LAFQITGSIPSEEFIVDNEYINIGVQSCYFDGWPHRFEISVANQRDPFFLSQETLSYYTRSGGQSSKPPYFIMQSYAHGYGINVALESCTNQPVTGRLYGTSNTSINFPITPSTAELVGENYRRYSNVITYRGDRFYQKQLLISYNANGGDTQLFTMFATSRGGDPRPSCTSIKRTFIRHLSADFEKPERDLHSIDIPPVTSNEYPLSYELYSLDLDSPDVERSNFETVCGIRNAELPKLIHSWDAESPRQFNIEAEFPHGKSFLINVIITDAKQRQQTCGTPAEVIEDEQPHPQPERPGNQQLSPIVVILAILISLFAIIIVCYLIIGMIVKKFMYGAKGIEMIPNVTFWRFLFSFGKAQSKSGSYGEVNINSVEVDDQIREDSKSDTNPFKNTSYGSI